MDLPNPFTASLPVTLVESREAPLMIHESVASGENHGQQFAVVRDLTGFRWHVRAGNTTATLSLFDLIKGVANHVTSVEAKRVVSEVGAEETRDV